MLPVVENRNKSLRKDLVNETTWQAAKNTSRRPIRLIALFALRSKDAIPNTEGGRSHASRLTSDWIELRNKVACGCLKRCRSL